MSAIPRPFTLMGIGSGGSPTFNGLTSTGTVVLTSAAASGLQLYNTADQTTNYERFAFFWGSNVAQIGVTNGGSGVSRDIQVSGGGSNATLRLRSSASTSGAVDFFTTTGSTAGSIGYRFQGGTSTATSGTNIGLSLTPTYNQPSGTAANTDLLVNRTETAVGSGAQLLMDLQVASATKFNVTNLGVANLTAASANPQLNFTRTGSNSGTAYIQGVNGGALSLRAFGSTTVGGITVSPQNDITNSSGTALPFTIAPTYNQTSTAAATDLLINRTQTAVGSGAQLLADFQVGGASQWRVSNNGTVTQAGALITTPQALSGAGAVNLTTTVTEYTSTGAAQALTLANGTVGQLKEIIHVVDGGSGVLTPTTASGFTTITFTNAGESAVLKYGSAGWVILSLHGAVAA